MISNKIAISICLLLITLLGTAFTFLYLDEKQIYGTIFDITSGEPIPAAKLQIGLAHTLSDGLGQFQINLIQQKNIALQANASGYLPTAFTFDIPWYARTSYLDIELSPVGLPLQIVDGLTNDPLTGLAIHIGNTTYLTNQAGLVHLNPLPLTPPFLISVNQPGYLPKQIKLTRLPDNSTQLPLVIELEPHILTGHVIAQDTQEPLANVMVTVGDDKLQTDINGYFSLYRLRPGDVISVWSNDHFLPTEFLFTGQSTLTIQLPARHLHVDVIDSFSGAPVHNAQVQISAQTSSTDYQGRAYFQRVPAQGMLQVSHAAHAPQTVKYDADQPNVVQLVPNAISGIIRDAVTGQPLTQTQILLNEKPFTLGPNGDYHLTDLSQPLHLDLKQAGYKLAHIVINAAPDFAVTTHDLTTQTCQEISRAQTAVPCLDLLLHPFAVKAIYVPFNFLSDTDTMYTIFDLIDRTELNAIVLDVKSDEGTLAWDSQVLQADLLRIDGDRDGWMTLETFLAESQKRDIYTIARMVIFKDTPLALGNSDLALAQADGTTWLDDSGAAWANPFRQEVWAYNIALAKEVAEMGFDEINLDYIRFPSDGQLEIIAFAEENTLQTRTAAIRTFFRLMQQALISYNTYISADVFGLTVWVDPENDMNIGQRVIDIAPYVDYLTPMIYPSTFIPGNLGLADPASQPYEVIFRSQQAAVERVPEATKVRPWLQAYWYSATDMLLQKQAANDANSAGWIWWNAAGVYEEAIFEAAP